ncbi:hypothetical protein [Dyadobacter tibetensis]|uniref:hypothetical protein n=1 Tax=Dyadobacter tibetensis TaxID=1211851 RepID=UPI00047081C5|nr:hypothetical protein [Dyadobacter tibetensis]
MRKIIIPFLLAWSFMACDKSAKTVEEASDRLVKHPVWHIDKISVNDRIVMKDGQSIPSFDGVQFDRYMSTISFNSDGTVRGNFNKGTAQTSLLWTKTTDHIAISSADTAARAGGGWKIELTSVLPNSFAMSTQTTAYDFPRTTNIVLHYVIPEDQ